MKNTLLFDLDGTLTDPAQGITNSVIYALRKFGIEVGDIRELYSFIGPPLYDSFREKFGLSHEDANLAITYYREYFAPYGKFENSVYEGIPEMLQKLKDSGKRMIVATSKPEKFAKQILDHFDLSKYFEEVIGATMDETRNKKDEVIKYAISELSLDVSDAVMIGDREYDVIGGHMNGLLSVGVLYGYGSREELEMAGADAIAENLKELEKILMKI